MCQKRIKNQFFFYQNHINIEWMLVFVKKKKSFLGNLEPLFHRIFYWLKHTWKVYLLVWTRFFFNCIQCLSAASNNAASSIGQVLEAAPQKAAALRHLHPSRKL